mgnify:CR=1 FL=1
MKRLMDMHTHAVASGHAYSTVDENLRWAAEQGLQLVALTDHAPAMKDTTCHAYFANLHVLPEMLHGVRLLKGIELNILDRNGSVDLDQELLCKLDYAIASMHSWNYHPGTRDENTEAFINVMKNPKKSKYRKKCRGNFFKIYRKRFEILSTQFTGVFKFTY